MPLQDNPVPIVDEHQAFAGDLVALARKHGANRLKVEFELTGSARFRDGWNPTRVRFEWGEGRHGSPARFALYAEAFISVEEPK